MSTKYDGGWDSARSGLRGDMDCGGSEVEVTDVAVLGLFIRGMKRIDKKRWGEWRDLWKRKDER